MARRAVGILTASYNTRELTALLLWSVRRVLNRPVSTVVVVDNASTDGSVELLAEAERAGICSLVKNRSNVGHGPALNQGMEVLRQRSRVDWVWILDSDCVVARPDSLDVLEASVAERTPVVIGEQHWDPWLNRPRFELYSLILDRRQALEHDLPPFNDGGDPSIDLLDGAERAGLLSWHFPFAADGHVIHRGRGSLAGVLERQEADHPLYEWAQDHHLPHYGGVTGASERYGDLVDRFRHEVGPDLDGLIPSLLML